MTTLELGANGTQGEALVDARDRDWLAQWTWYSNGLYAVRPIRHAGRSHTVYMHRVILHAPTVLEVDHINGNKFDNRRANLRLVTRSENMQNVKAARSDSATGVRGVYRKKKDGRYRARVYLQGREINVGTFATLEEAEQAAVSARASMMTHAPECEVV